MLRIGTMLGLLIGLGAGVGGYTFVYARGASYLTNNPSACANCHIMQGHFDAWTKSSHHNAAVCNDCHVPKPFFRKYYAKAENGARHSWAFTTGWFHEPIEITPGDHAIVEENCRRCHQDIVQMIDAEHNGDSEMLCTRCHQSVGHLE